MNFGRSSVGIDLVGIYLLIVLSAQPEPPRAAPHDDARFTSVFVAQLFKRHISASMSHSVSIRSKSGPDIFSDNS